MFLYFHAHFWGCRDLEYFPNFIGWFGPNLFGGWGIHSITFLTQSFPIDSDHRWSGQATFHSPSWHTYSISGLMRSCGSCRSIGKSETSPGIDLDHSRGSRGPSRLSLEKVSFFFVHCAHLARPDVPRFVDPLYRSPNDHETVTQDIRLPQPKIKHKPCPV